jgi:hypothetical protein
MTKLTIGMAVHNDFNGVYFTIQALNMYHKDCDIKIIVVDNKPTSLKGKAVKRFVNNWVHNGEYIPFDEIPGTSATRNLIFSEATTPYVLCIDSHVLLDINSIKSLLEYYDENPNTDNLIQGPLLYDDFKISATHMRPRWRDNMYGTWNVNPIVKEGKPFEIPMHGLGLFSCRKDAWLGFNPNFRGFGGEEGYIHKKYKQAGHKTICLPQLRWGHRFNNNAIPNSYVNSLDDRFRNYLLGWSELNLSIKPVLEHFKGSIKPTNVIKILADCNIDPSVL